MDNNGIRIYTDIKELNNEILRTVYANVNLRRMFAIEAELSNFVVRGENIFFTLKDSNGVVIDCFVRGYRAHRIDPRQFRNGDQVTAKGNIEVWTNKAEFRFVAVSLDQGGEGAMLARLRALRERLTAEGLFDPAHKKKLPKYPRRIGLVTSYDRDAYHDVVDNTFAKNPYISFKVMDTLMQGSSAPASVVSSIRALDVLGLDMIVVTRGGGTAEDRWTFNDERIIRAIYEAGTPIVTAIGHTANFDHMADMVADVSIVVPTAVAADLIPNIDEVFGELDGYLKDYSVSLHRRIDRLELVLDNYLQKLQLKSPKNQLINRRKELDGYSDRLKSLVNNKHLRYSAWLDSACAKLLAKSPEHILKEKKQSLDYLDEKLKVDMNNRMAQTSNRLENLIVRLNGLSPTAKLVNGFGYVAVNNEALRSAKDVSKGDKLMVTVSDGNLNAVVESVELKDNI